jgi:hypothetical protein
MAMRPVPHVGDGPAVGVRDARLSAEERAIHRQISRRGFLGAAAGGVLATLAGREPALARAAQIAPTADAVVVLWMAGGMAQTETFDPKRYTPFAPGVAIKDVLSTFPTIDTAVDHIKFTEGLERIGQVIDRGAVIRSFMAADLGFILHSRHQYHWHTGYVPPQTVACPHLGAWMAKVLGPNNPVIPPFINIGQRLEEVGEREELKAFTTAGFFGNEFGPMNLPYPTTLRAVTSRCRIWFSTSGSRYF